MMKLKKHIFLFVFIANCLLTTANSFCQGVWTQKADFGGTARAGAFGFSIGTKGYIGTGSGFIDFWEWDQASNTWTQKADFGGGAGGKGVGFSIGQMGYVGTGSYGGYSDYFWEWDQVNNLWSQKSNFAGTKRATATGFSIGSKGYIGTGRDAGSSIYGIIDFWEWDQSVDAWTQKADFGGGKRDNATGFSIGAKGYLGLGNGNSPAYNDFWEWDPVANSWTQMANIPGTKRYNNVGFSIGTRGYIGTGWDGPAGSLSSNIFWQWDQVSNIWTQVSACSSIGRHDAVGFTIGTKGYVGTGMCAKFVNTVYVQVPLNDFWEYCDTCSVVGGIELAKSFFSTVYPNPFFTQTTFTFSEHIKDGTLKIYSVTGQEVRKSQIAGDKFKLERDELKGGVYFYQIISESTTIETGKLIIQ